MLKSVLLMLALFVVGSDLAMACGGYDAPLVIVVSGGIK